MGDSFWDKLLYYGFLLVLFSLCIPIIALYGRIETRTLVGGYLPEGEYVCISDYSNTPSNFTIDKNKDTEFHHQGRDISFGYMTTINNTTYYLNYSKGYLKMSPNAPTPMKTENILMRNNGIYFIKATYNSDRPYLYFTKADNKNAVNKMIKFKENYDKLRGNYYG